MFKKFAFVAAGLVTLLVGSAALSQEQQGTQPQNSPMYFTRSACDIAPVMMDLLVNKYREELLFTGNGMTFDARTGQPMKGGLFFFTNQDTGSFSVVQVFADGIGCMLMNGTNFTPYLGD